ncbi:S8 family serine peptidase [Brevibacillus borstelensis]|uniref:S8 family serine peptidase n=1 Tax=Brevibacillus borstelensis TaxID=45462 RepID=UPI0025594BFD|nr:S8 family serine peptidase [Brevibacillus borstelensis]
MTGGECVKKQAKSFIPLSLSAALLFSVAPGGVYASEDLSKRELSKLNSVTNAVVEQGAATAKISPRLNTTSRKEVSVIVQLQGEPAASEASYKRGSRSSATRSAESRVSREQTSFLKEARKKNIDLHVERTFSHVFNGMEMTLPANEIESLASLPQVKAVYENTIYTIPDVELDAMNGREFKYDIAPLKQIGVLDMWDEGLTGKGLKVGVIDTGVDYLHPDLKDAYKGGYDSYDNDKDPYEEAPISPDDDAKGEGGYEGSSHGTHVSGTIVGRAKNKTSDVQVKGIAYEADLYVYRVLGRKGGSSAQVIDGIEKAVRDGMDVINLSLGADIEKNADSPDSIAVNNAMRAGVITVVANGNAASDEPGRFYYTAGSPAGAKLPISVAAVNSPSVLYDASASSSLGQDYQLHVMAWQIREDNFSELIGTNPLPVVYANLGSVQDFEKVDVAGKVALVSRGTLAFTDKIINAKKAGAVAVIVFNGNDKDGDGQADLNLPPEDRGGYVDTILGDQMDAIPTFDMKGTEGRALALQLLNNPSSPVTLTFSSDYPTTSDNGDKVASFSSRGPVLGDNYSIKPDVGAPGVSILSAYPAWSKLIDGASYEKAYARSNGTSMATPHVAGLALLLKEAHPEWTPFDVKAALSNTAKPLYEEEDVLYDVYSQGAGRVDGFAAMKTPALLQTVEQLTILNEDFEAETIEYNGSNYSFGLLKAGSKPVSQTLQVKNTSDKEVSYRAEVNMHSSVTTDPYRPKDTPDPNNIDVKLSTKNITVDGGEIETFTLTVEPQEDAEEGVYEGEVVLRSSDRSIPKLHLPFVIHVGDKPEDTHFGLDNMKLSSAILSPDGDGENDTITVEALLQAEGVNVIELEAWSMDDTYIGTMAALFNDYKPFAPGPITFSNIDGTYVNGSLIPKKLDPGVYKLRLVAQVVDPDLPRGEQVVETYEIWKSFKLEINETEKGKRTTEKNDDSLKQAAEEFEGNVVNTDKVGEAVLELPEDSDAVTYAVTESSHPELIDNAGVLLALPEEGNETVTLWVTIASKDNPDQTEKVKVKVKLEAGEESR